MTISSDRLIEILEAEGFVLQRGWGKAIIEFSRKKILQHRQYRIQRKICHWVQFAISFEAVA